MLIIKNAIIIFLFMVLILISGCDLSQGQTPAKASGSPAGTSPVMSKPPPASNITLPPEAVYIEDVVLEADLIVIGEITSQKYEVINEKIGRMIYTLNTLSVEKTIKGDSTKKEVLIKVLGGNNREIALPYLEGHSFAITDKTLICLKNETDNTYDVISKESSDGLLWLDSKVNKFSQGSDLKIVLGWVILVMKKYDIPIVLPQKDMPFLPGAPTKGPR